MMVANLLIKILNNPDGSVYQPGQTIQACVQLFMSERHCVKRIYVKFKGKGQTSWSSGSVRNRTYHGETERYFKSQITLLEAIDDDYFELQPGDFEYPVDFVLPIDLPSSFVGLHGSVRYHIKAKMEVKGGEVYRVKFPFKVKYMLNLNSISGAKLPVQIEGTKTGCCCCCKIGPVTCKMWLDRQGYVPGESIYINAEVTNNGTSLIHKISVSLVMTSIFKAYGDKKMDRKVVSSVSHGTIGPGEKDIWNGDQLDVPPTPSSYLYRCTIIDIQYTCQLAVEVEGSLLNIVFDLPIVIGTIPLHDDGNVRPHRSASSPLVQNWNLLSEQTDNTAITSQPASLNYERFTKTDKVRRMNQKNKTGDFTDITNLQPQKVTTV
ncbi:arrestin domain-containing protein 3-like isoform X2 [Argopecten irradians]|uniref:arrestin domain-containing protein 3-like isoform X2 n=1 Tax=Argopecten irradians TaxID=31199 RepID=UPI003717354F